MFTYDGEFWFKKTPLFHKWADFFDAKKTFLADPIIPEL
jgi:hypothetical protein